uniref:MRH domain-containing protein n=1 Tax=Panagrolaimus sp. JU765 TaxID=591449 RepID=A0AC34QV94_9BILA
MGYLFLALILSVNVVKIFSRQCDSSEFVYEFTECDDHGERWRIALPKNHDLQCDNVPQPQSGVNCSFSCAAGHYLDLKNQACLKCPSGSYSLGSGQRYERLLKWPPGFSVENYPDPTGQVFNRDSPQMHCPSSSGWVIEEGEIRYQPTSCISKLSISLQLVQNGYIEFTVKMPKNSRGLVSNIDVRNEQCQSYANQLASLTSSNQDDSLPDWGLKKITLKRGHNLLTWTIANNIEMTTLADIIYVPKIDIIGLPYTSSCTLCPAGTYAEVEGKEFCDNCPANFFSGPGAKTCNPCSSFQYSLPRSSICKQKPSCETFDYFPVFDVCRGGQQNIDYSNLQPIICQEFLSLAVKRPTSVTKPCLKCNPGQERNLHGKCDYCPTGQFSTGISCQKCPPSTRPNYGFFLTNWEKLPDFAETSCEYVTSEEVKECNIKPAWIPFGDRLETAPSRDSGVAMELGINISSGFYNLNFDENSKLSEDNPIASVSVDLETKCSDESCTMYIVQEMMTKQRSFRFLMVLNGTIPRQIQQYPIYHNGNCRFIIAFTKSGTTVGTGSQNDKAIIYSFNITNVGNAAEKKNYGGADSCIPCPIMDQMGNCHPCPSGNYIDPKANKCVKCPPGTRLNRTSSLIGSASCVKCGPNMESEDGVECTFTGKITVESKEPNEKPMKFDFGPLKKKKLVAEGIKVFAREGNSYFHSFNVSIFETINCQDLNNYLPFSLLQKDDSGSDNDAQFCRLTAVPLNYEGNDTHANRVIFASPLVIGKKIVSITKDRYFKGFYLTDKDLEYDTMADKSRPIDIHFYFDTITSHVRRCVNGTLGVLTARCEPTATNEPQTRLSRNCPDGTCDGCLFHVIVETSHACPICDTADFQEIRGECINGKQQVHWIPSKHCILSGAQTKERTETCTSSSGLKMLLILAGVLIAFLILVNVLFYQRNRNLEYKYMRIIEGKEPEEMETCGLESDDDDLEDEENDARVYFGRKKNYFVAGIKKTGTKNTVVDQSAGNSKKLTNDEEQENFLSLDES